MAAPARTKPNHPWTNGQVERMNRTIKDATVKRYRYADHQQLTAHLELFVAAYNHARRLKTLKGSTPHQYVCQIWTEEPERFRTNPYHHTPGLNTQTIGYLRAGVGASPSVIEEQKRLLGQSAHRPSRAYVDRGTVPGQPQLQACLAALATGDALVAASGDRLTHSVDALLAMEEDLHRRGVGLVLLSFNGAVVDFRTAEAAPVLDLLSEIARWEYRGLRERQHAGIAKARQEGRYRGRRAVIPAEAVRQRLQAGERPSTVARELGVARSSVYRVAATTVAAEAFD